MSEQQTSRSAIVISRILGTLSSIIGYTIVIIFGIPLVLGAFKDAGSIIFVLICLAIAAVLIVNGIKIKKTIKRFKKYISIISVENQTSLENIASICSQSIDFVTNDLQKMINKKYFTNAYIDKSTNEFVLQKKNHITENNVMKKDDAVELMVVTCKSCGASNSVPKGMVTECEFCGTAIQA